MVSVVVYHSLSVHGLALPVQWLDVFGRAGGGGSSSGGGGGGEILLLIGYLPAHFMADWFNKHRSAAAGYIAGIITTLAVMVLFLFIYPPVMIFIGLGAVLGVYSGTHNWWSRIRSRIKKSQSLLNYASQRDGVWQEDAIKNRVEEVFMQFQADWTNFDLERIQTYTSPRYFEHVRLMMIALDQLERQNVVGQPQIQQLAIADVMDDRNNDNDHFTAYIQASAHDVLGDVRSQRELYADDSVFEELWTFDRQGNEWVLDGIEQATADPKQLQPAIRQFAQRNDMYYSLDWGWLLLPQSGQLFSQATFKDSDVNNHVIGEWQGLLVQLYTYIPDKKRGQADNYLVGQITLPKQYSGILVRRRDTETWFSRAPVGYLRIATEWPDFNRRYHLYAMDADKVTSFELLNPAFMAWLYDHDLPVSFEVVDNIVYLYARTVVAGEAYEEMLEILRRAFEELKR